MRIIKIIEFYERNTNNMKFLEFHVRIMKIVQIKEFNARIIKIIKNKIKNNILENFENHFNFKIPFENHKNHECHRIQKSN